MLRHEEFGAMDHCQKKFMVLDLFRQPFRFLLPDREDMYRTFLGSSLSLLCFIILLGFGALKVTALATSSDYKIQVHDKKFFYDDVDEFTFDESQFMVSAGVTAFDGSSEDITDPEVGEIKFYMKRFGDVPFTLTELGKVPCK